MNARLTWQASEKNKITLFGDNQWRDWDDSRPIHSPEATRMRLPRLFITSWVGPPRSATAAARRPLQIKGEGYLDAAPLGDLIPVFEQSTGFFYKAPARTFGNPVGAQVAGCPASTRTCARGSGTCPT